MVYDFATKRNQKEELELSLILVFMNDTLPPGNFLTPQHGLHQIFTEYLQIAGGMSYVGSKFLR